MAKIITFVAVGNIGSSINACPIEDDGEVLRRHLYGSYRGHGDGYVDPFSYHGGRAWGSGDGYGSYRGQRDDYVDAFSQGRGAGRSHSFGSGEGGRARHGHTFRSSRSAESSAKDSGYSRCTGFRGAVCHSSCTSRSGADWHGFDDGECLTSPSAYLRGDGEGGRGGHGNPFRSSRSAESPGKDSGYSRCAGFRGAVCCSNCTSGSGADWHGFDDGYAERLNLSTSPSAYLRGDVTGSGNGNGYRAL